MSVEVATQSFDRSVARTSTLRIILRNPLVRVGIVLLGLALTGLIVALVIGWVDPSAPWNANLTDINAAPFSHGHLLGTDSGGRDVLVRLVVATKSTLLSAVIALVVAVALGVPGGLIAGYYGGWVDMALDWLSSLAMSLPSLVVLMAIISALGTSIWITMPALGCMMAPAVFRLIRAQVNAVRRELYIDAAKVSGLSDRRIISRHVFSVVRGPLVLMISVMAGVAITVQTGLDFIGLGDSTTITWGGMLSDGFAALHVNGTLFVWPAAAMSLTVLAFFLIASGARDGMQRLGAPAPGVRGKPVVAHLKPVPNGPRWVAPEPDEVLVVRDLVVAYPGEEQPVEVVRGASLRLRRGRTLGLVGESGSGKTQTAFAVLDLLPRQAQVLAGEIWLDGVELVPLPSRQRERRIREAIAYIPQEPMSNLDPAFTIGFQLIEPLRARGVSRAEARVRAGDLLARMGIADPDRVLRSYPHQISGGMAQRVLIAGAVSTEPQVLVADEPTTALDVTAQSEILELLRGLQREMHMSIVLVTHDLGVVADLCDDVAVMRAGQVVESASVAEFFDNPRHEYSRMLLAAVPDEHHVREEYAEHAEDLESSSLGGAG